MRPVAHFPWDSVLFTSWESSSHGPIFYNLSAPRYVISLGLSNNLFRHHNLNNCVVTSLPLDVAS